MGDFAEDNLVSFGCTTCPKAVNQCHNPLPAIHEEHAQKKELHTDANLSKLSFDQDSFKPINSKDIAASSTIEQNFLKANTTSNAELSQTQPIQQTSLEFINTQNT